MTPSHLKEQFNNDHHGQYHLYPHYNEEINHPNYEPEEIITEPNLQLDINHNNTQDVQPDNVRTHRSGRITGSTNARVHSSGILTGMTCVTSIIRQVEPNSIDQAWNHTDIDERRKWRLVIKDELTSMIHKNVLSPVKVKDEQEVSRPLGMRWVVKIKDNGRYRAMLVAKGFLQREGVDYDLIHSPVLCDITFRLLLVYHLLNPKTIMVEVDIKKAFLESKIEEEIYIKTPDILKTLDNNFKNTRFSKLNMSVYGLVQAANNFYDELTNYLQSKNFNIYEGEPCLLNKQEVYVGLYVDDLLIIGPTNQVNTLLEELKNIFEVRVDKDIKEFVGCELIVQDYKIILHQRKIIAKLLQEFNEEIKDLKFKGCPMGNLTKVIRPSDDSQDLLSTQKQVRYQSGVGSLLYIVKHSRPDLNNSVRELSKIMDRANEEGYKKLLQVLNFVRYTTDLGIIFETSKTLTWNLE